MQGYKIDRAWAIAHLHAAAGKPLGAGSRTQDERAALAARRRAANAAVKARLVGATSDQVRGHCTPSGARHMLHADLTQVSASTRTSAMRRHHPMYLRGAHRDLCGPRSPRHQVARTPWATPFWRGAQRMAASLQGGTPPSSPTSYWTKATPAVRSLR